MEEKKLRPFQTENDGIQIIIEIPTKSEEESDSVREEVRQILSGILKEQFVLKGGST